MFSVKAVWLRGNFSTLEVSDARDEIHLPRSFTSEDSRALLERYIDSEDANLNYVGLIASAKETPAAGTDARLKLHAKLRGEDLNAKFFTTTHG